MKDEIIEKVKAKLMCLGYTMETNDSIVLNFAYDRAIFEVKNFCNINELTEDFIFPLIELTMCYFLEQQLTSKYLTGEELSKTVKSISEGDISISYDITNPEEVLKKYVSQHMSNIKASLVRFRRLKW